MTRSKAAEKVASIRRLAERAGTEAEADNAKRAAERLIKEHGLTEVEISLGSLAAAFDDLMNEMDTFTRKNSAPAVVLEVIQKAKKDTKPEDKADALRKIVIAVRAISLFTDISKVKNVIDDVLRKHGVTV